LFILQEEKDKPVIRYILRRLLWSIPVLIGVTLFIFLLIHLIPGDPVKIFYGIEMNDPKLIALKREELGLNDPLIIQYFRFVLNALRGDFGVSIQTLRPVLPDLIQRLGNTAQLATLSIVLAVVLGILFGILSALKPYSLLDNLTLGVSLAGISLPVFWIGLLLMWLFSVRLGLLPPAGKGDWRNLILPAVTMSGPSLALVARITRANILEVIHRDYVRTAQSKGLRVRNVMIRHVLPNALLPTITVIGLQFGYLLAGAVLTESVFTWPGLGRLIVDSIKTRDYPVVQGGVILIAVIFVLINLSVDLTYGLLDPRIRTES
jgi:peptide/nickel transport system permease protein